MIHQINSKGCDDVIHAFKLLNDTSSAATLKPSKAMPMPSNVSDAMENYLTMTVLCCFE